jgi:stalled ribosome rescue protein Dom34
MKRNKHLGIWMDHSVAHLMALTNDSIVTILIESKFSHSEKEQSLKKSENLMHNKEQHLLLGYYKRLMDTIRNYQEVVLFGPTTAKNELLNLLKADLLFDNIKIEIRHADQMTTNQQHAFVREYFTPVVEKTNVPF